MSRQTFDRLTYGITLNPVKLIREDHTITAPTREIAAVEMRRDDPIVRVEMASDVDDECSRQLAVEFVEERAGIIAVYLSAYEAPSVTLSWMGAAGQSGRIAFMRGESHGSSTAKGTLERVPALDAAFMRDVSAVSFPPWARELNAELAESTKLGGASGYVALFEAVKHAAADVLGRAPTERTADEWLLQIEPAIPTSPNPNPRRAGDETEFSRIRAEFAHHKDRGVELAHGKAQAAAALPRLIRVVQAALRSGLGI